MSDLFSLACALARGASEPPAKEPQDPRDYLSEDETMSEHALGLRLGPKCQDCGKHKDFEHIFSCGQCHRDFCEDCLQDAETGREGVCRECAE